MITKKVSKSKNIHLLILNLNKLKTYSRNRKSIIISSIDILKCTLVFTRKKVKRRDTKETIVSKKGDWS